MGEHRTSNIKPKPLSKETRKYSNDEITVVWKPTSCIHSAICWKGMIEVFNPKERPWIKMNGSTTEKIIEQVRKCPSGALSYYWNKDAGENIEGDKVIAESAKIMRIEVTPNGPYLIKTECLLVHSDGTEEIKTGTVALCRCGSSTTKPYCDGRHKLIGFEG
jgi:uncharacterized Fe-S cluster protein YjdI